MKTWGGLNVNWFYFAWKLHENLNTCDFLLINKRMSIGRHCIEEGLLALNMCICIHAFVSDHVLNNKKAAVLSCTICKLEHSCVFGLNKSVISG